MPGLQIVGNPAVIRRKDDRLDVYARGTDNAIWHAAQVSPGGAFGAWVSLGGGLASDPAVGRTDLGEVQVFARGFDNAMWRTTERGGGWVSMGGAFRGNPAVGRNQDGRLELFTIGYWDGSATHAWQTRVDGPWSGFASYGGYTSSTTPDVVTNADGRLSLFVVGGNDRAVYVVSQTAPSSSWGPAGAVTGLRVIPD